MKTAVTILAALAFAATAGVCQAATIQNQDESEYQLRIVEDGQERQVALQPNTEAADLCANKCDLYVGTDPDPFELFSTDKLVIKGGQLMFEGEAAEGQGSGAPKP